MKRNLRGLMNLESRKERVSRNTRSGRLLNLALHTPDEEHEENEGEFEREKHSFRNQEYPGLDPQSDPVSDPFSGGSSADSYHPPSEEDEGSDSDYPICDKRHQIASEEDEGSDSDGSICDKRHQRVTGLMSLNITQPDLHQVQHTTEQLTDFQLQTCLIPQNTTELSSHQQQVDIMPRTTEGHQSKATESNDLIEKSYLILQNTTELPSHQQQVDIMPRTTEGHQSQATESNDLIEKSYLILQNTTELPSHQQQVDIMPRTTEGHQSQATESNDLIEKSYLILQNTTELPSHQQQVDIMPRTTEGHQSQATESNDLIEKSYLILQNTTELPSHQQQVDIMPRTTEGHQSQATESNDLIEKSYLILQNTTELPSHQQQVDIMPRTTEGHQSQATESNDLIDKGRNRDFCFYCETHVLNFARHIIRQHYLEVDVQKILAFPKKSLTRRKLITELKKKGNYISNVVRCERPMRNEKRLDKGDYLPCSNCLGFYARKQLWKHKKKCDPEHKGSQAEAQNLMCRNSLHIPSKSLQKVFKRMRADKISFIAKQDPIICQFGENYMKIHREEHFIPVTSRKMRELAKLLIEVKKIKPEIKTYFDALKPQNYDTFVAATKIVAKYNESTDRYCSPTYAMNISTSIKQCCNIAIMKILKTETSIKSAEMQADLKTLVQLIESNWKFDVSSNAADDLNLKKWNKVTIVPLASDLKLLKDHLCAVAQNSAAQLREAENYQNTAAYNELSETVFCRALLLNRRRPGELQRLMLSTYVENEHNKEYQYEEFDRTLTATERILVQRFKRIVIRGKRSRGVPVLFSTDVQQDLDLLISLRSKYIDSNNKFLFAKPSSMTCLCGYKVLQKHVKLSGAKNPEAISSTKLRKHLATLTQLFNMSENDIEQLSNFMGHTTGVHRRNYRLPDDIFQTAKISKLLILMEDGKADSFKGKSLDEINLNMEEDLEGEGLEIEDVLNVAENENTLQEPDMATDMSATTAQDLATPLSDNGTSVCEPLAEISNITSRSTKKKRVLVPWTSPQKKIVTDHFKRHIRSKKAPKRHECDELKALYPELLRNKDWLKIKVFIQNYYSKR